jgi:NAD(P)-dependent dehydrogenase (short-subunit alcohol dehydrogenase family)
METTMSKKLEGKIAVVTGGSAGIGLGAAKEFAVEGARVFITGRRQAELDRAVAEIGHNAIGIQGDASKLPDIKRIYDTVKEKAGRIDVLFANAGFYELQKFGEITEEHFDNTFGTNVRGLLFAVQGALPLLSKKSSVIFTGSIAANIGIPAMSVYSATKAAIRSFARSWILDLKGSGIRFNVLSPGHTVTPGLNKLLTDENKNDLIGTIPLGRLGTPLDLAKAAVFLASDDSEYITGTELEVDGGVAQY